MCIYSFFINNQNNNIEEIEIKKLNTNFFINTEKPDAEENRLKNSQDGNKISKEKMKEKITAPVWICP